MSEPLDAYRQFLQARREAGDFEILDEDIEQDFWAYFTDEQKHDFIDEDEAKRAFAKAPW